MPVQGRSLVLLAVVLAGAFALRTHGLDARTLTHPECYVPLLDFRPPFDSPAPRTTLWETLQRTIDDDNHPPAQLVFMYAWNRVFGTGLFALRFPAVLFGVAGVLFTFLLARRSDGEHTALFASFLLALNGLHVFWSQHARIWVLVTAIAAASLWLLAGLVHRPTRARALAYVAVCALGLWTEYYFWIFFLGQIAFVLARARPWETSATGQTSAAREASATGKASAAHAERVTRAATSPPPLLRLHAAALLLATPLAVFLWSHLTLRRHFVVPRTLPRLVEVLAGDGLADLGLAEHWLGAAGPPLYYVVAALGLALLVRGAWRAPSEAVDAAEGVDTLHGRGCERHRGGVQDFPTAAAGVATHEAAGARPMAEFAPRGLLVACGVLAVLMLAGMYAWGLAKPHWIAAALVLPPIALLGWRGLESFWPRLALFQQSFASNALGRFLARDLVTTSFVVPLAAFAAISVVKPMLVSRGLLILAPAASILFARAVLSLRSRALRQVTAALLVLLAALSAHFGKTRLNAPADFGALGRELAQRTQPGEPIAVPNKWFAQPILYYVDQDRNPAMTPEVLAEQCERGVGPQRFWLTLFVLEEEVTEDPAEVERMDARIAAERARFAEYGYENEETARAFGGAAVAFVRRE